MRRYINNLKKYGESSLRSSGELNSFLHDQRHQIYSYQSVTFTSLVPYRIRFNQEKTSGIVKSSDITNVSKSLQAACRVQGVSSLGSGAFKDVPGVKTDGEKYMIVFTCSGILTSSSLLISAAHMLYDKCN